LTFKIYVTGPAKTRHVGTNYTLSLEGGKFHGHSALAMKVISHESLKK